MRCTHGRCGKNFLGFCDPASPRKPVVCQSIPRSSHATSPCALLKSDGHTSITDWNSGDHGSDFEWKAILDAHDGVMHAKLRSLECQAEGSGAKLIEEVDR
jgi:hypothetical protein